MSEDNKPANSLESKEKVAVDLIWDLLDRDAILPELIQAWPGINALAFRDDLIPPNDPDAGPMPVGFAYFLSKDLRDIKMESRVDRAARYMSETVINTMQPTWINIIHSFLVFYNNFRRPRSSRGVSSRIKMMINNVEGLDLDPTDPPEHQGDERDGNDR